MSTWKVILAILVVFAAGLLTGGAVLRKFRPEPTPRSWESQGGGAFLPREIREDYVKRLSRELKLSPAQTEEISKIVAQSQQRVRNLYEQIGPEMRMEMRQVRESVRAVLTPEQQKHFDEIRKHRHQSSPSTPTEGGRPRYRTPSPGDKPASPGRGTPSKPDSSQPAKTPSSATNRPIRTG